jgi:hypothetical protein
VPVLVAFLVLAGLVPVRADPVAWVSAPRTSGAVPMPVRFRLRNGFELAVDRLERVPGCRALFGALGVDGLDLLAGAAFELPTGSEQNRLCRRAVAFTRPGSGRIVVCPVRVRAMPTRDLAAILLHEALHLGGLGEWPHDPDAPTSGEITAVVRRRCEL